MPGERAKGQAKELTKKSRRLRRVPYGVHAAYGTGVALILFGAAGMVAESHDTAPAGWAMWVGGAALAHDLVLAPLVLLAGVLLGRLPYGLREPLRVAAIIAGCLTVVALPMVLGLGTRAGDASRLPLPYGRNLLAVVTAVAAAALLYALVRHGRRSRGRSAPRQPRQPGRSDFRTSANLRTSGKRGRGDAR